MTIDLQSTELQTALHYVRSYQQRVVGRMPSSLSQSVIALSQLQSTARVTGPIAEIGVHHGKFFLLLLSLTSEGERGLAIDLFDRQSENVDASGAGDRQILEKHLANLRGVGQRAVVLQANSMEVMPEEVISRAGGEIRLFSVDGGHTAEITANDLHIACESITDGGIIFLDDYFNPGWPGVSEGAMRYFSSLGKIKEIVPFAIVGGKILFTTGGKSDQYRDGLVNAGFATWKNQELLGRPVINYEYQRSRLLNVDYWKQTRLWQRIKNRPIAEKLRRATLSWLR